MVGVHAVRAERFENFSFRIIAQDLHACCLPMVLNGICWFLCIEFRYKKLRVRPSSLCGGRVHDSIPKGNRRVAAT